MPINQNHTAEELEGVKCSIVEKNVSKDRVEFLKNLLTHNGYNVVVSATPPPKVVAAKPIAQPAKAGVEVEPAPVPLSPPFSAEIASPPLLPETFTIGVTDLIFNPTNAIFGRLLLTPNGHVVTLAYWYQKEVVAHDEVPYYENQG